MPEETIPKDMLIKIFEDIIRANIIKEKDITEIYMEHKFKLSNIL
jgi:hypothetical protein